MEAPPGTLAAVARVHAAVLSVLKSVPGPACLQDLAAGLAERGLLVTLRTGLPVGVDCAEYLSTLRHSFLICQSCPTHRHEPPGPCVIVDPAFREQFAVAGLPAASQHAAAVGTLPKTFVGTIITVNALATLLSASLAEEARALGLELPPWRSRAALLSHWLPRRFRDEAHSPRGAAVAHPARWCSAGACCDAPAQQIAASPTSVQGWQTSRGGESGSSSTTSTTCSTTGSHASGSPSSSHGAHERSAAAQAHRPTRAASVVVRGFSAPPPPPPPSSPCGPRAPGGSAVPPAPARSALTAQLAAGAAAAARSAWAPIAAAAGGRAGAGAGAAAPPAVAAVVVAASTAAPVPCAAQASSVCAAAQGAPAPGHDADDVTCGGGGSGVPCSRLEAAVRAIVAPPAQQACCAAASSSPDRTSAAPPCPKLPVVGGPRVRPRAHMFKVAGRSRSHGPAAGRASRGAPP